MKRYKCKYCSREFNTKTPHLCRDGYRKHHLDFYDQAGVPNKIPFRLSEEQKEQLSRLQESPHYEDLRKALQAEFAPKTFHPKRIDFLLNEMLKSNGILPGTITVVTEHPEKKDFPLPSQTVYIKFEYCNCTESIFNGVDRILINYGEMPD